jgi:UDP-GlcNAc:undecaprenyl-phosphate GlcNAc-1-phosphate transferase
MFNGNSLFIVFAFIVALIVAYAATPLVKSFSFKIGAVDVPKDGRRMHDKPIATCGGLAIFYGFFVSVICFSQWQADGALNWPLIGVLTGSAAITLLGVFDDVKPRPALLKLAVQIAAALVPVLLGVRMNAIANPFNSGVLYPLPLWMSVTLSVIWIVGVTNAVNLIDGLDGLAVGVSSIAAVALLSMLLLKQDTTITLLVMAAALAGGCFGFLPYNFNPAKIFMGDAGATFLGFVLACISIQGPFKIYVAFTVPLLILGLPIFDTLFAIIRRLAKGKPIMAPDRGHLHHRLIDKGFSHKTVVIILYGLSAMLAISGLALLFAGLSQALILIICVLLFIVFGLNSSAENGENAEEKPEKDGRDEEN